MKNFIILLLLQFSIFAFAQPGSLDPTFNTGTGVKGGVGPIFCSVLQSDGRIIIGGDFTSCNGVARNRVARLNADGSLDMSFNPGKGPEMPGKYTWVRKTCLQPDGKIIIGGGFSTYNGTARNNIARLNTDGSLDNSFNPGTGPDDHVEALSLQSNGKIIMGGNLKNYTGTTGFGIARLNTDGSLDMSFDPGKGPNNSIRSIAIQSDGRIIIGGYFDSYNGITKSCVARLNADGSLDTSFNSGTFENIDDKSPHIDAALVQPDGKIIVAGVFTSYSGKNCTSILRLNADGSLDNSFNLIQYGSVIFAIALQSDGKIIAGGYRLNEDGSFDECFPQGGNPNIRTILIQPNGKIIIGGVFDAAIERINVGLSPPTAIAQSFCDGAKVANLVAQGTNIKWYTTATGGTVLAADGILSTTTYYAAQCDSERTAVPVTIKESIVPIFKQVSPICSGTALVLPPASDNGIAGTWSPPSDITKTTTYTFNPAPESCGTTTTMTVEVKVLPSIDADYTKVICSGSNEDVQLNAGLLSGSQSDYSYTWSKDGALLPSEQGYNITVNTDGVYTCVVKDNITGCEKTRTNTVSYSVDVTIKDVVIADLTQHNTVTVVSSNSENSEYSLDNPTGPFQDSNVFENVEAGIHTVYLNDKKGCGMVSKTIAVVGAPPFFTPNGDGFNDKWNLQGIDATFYKNSTVDIFDRYGKLIKVLPDAQSDGWDGTYNGHPQPSNDYWFVIHMEDGRVVKGHFSLIR